MLTATPAVITNFNICEEEEEEEEAGKLVERGGEGEVIVDVACRAGASDAVDMMTTASAASSPTLPLPGVGSAAWLLYSATTLPPPLLLPLPSVMLTFVASEARIGRGLVTFAGIASLLTHTTLLVLLPPLLLVVLSLLSMFLLLLLLLLFLVGLVVSCGAASMPLSTGTRRALFHPGERPRQMPLIQVHLCICAHVQVDTVMLGAGVALPL